MSSATDVALTALHEAEAVLEAVKAAESAPVVLTPEEKAAGVAIKFLDAGPLALGPTAVNGA